MRWQYIQQIYGKSYEREKINTSTTRRAATATNDFVLIGRDASLASGVNVLILLGTKFT